MPETSEYQKLLKSWRGRRFVKRNGKPIKTFSLDVYSGDAGVGFLNPAKCFNWIYAYCGRDYLKVIGEFFKELDNLPDNWLITDIDRVVPVDGQDRFTYMLDIETNSSFRQHFTGTLDLSLIGIPRYLVGYPAVKVSTPSFGRQEFDDLVHNYPVFGDFFDGKSKKHTGLIAFANVLEGKVTLADDLNKNILKEIYNSGKVGEWFIDLEVELMVASQQ